MRYILILLTALTFLSGGSRIALLIGNSEYKYIDRLKNPNRKLRELKRVLENLGFTVKIKLDLDSVGLFEAMENFSKELSKDRDNIGFLYYSGHGCQVDNKSYLIPIDVNTKLRSRIRHHALSVNEMLDMLEKDAGNRVNMLFLDACRDVPTGLRGGGTKGLGQISTPKGVLVVYATEEGKTASDNDNFINALIENIATPNIKIRDIADNIVDSVAEVTNENQIPVIFYKRLPKLILNRTDSRYKREWNYLIYRGKRSYSKNSRNTVKDNYTGLIWQKRGSKNRMSWEDAKEYCQNLTLDGYSDWRLPTIKELYYLADRTKYNPAIDTNYFNIKSSFYWSSTTYKNNSSGSWYIFFIYGYDFWDYKSFESYVVCVR